jgi:hypothetical protein
MSLHADGSQFSEAEQDDFIFGDVVGAFICLAGELESCFVA